MIVNEKVKRAKGTELSFGATWMAPKNTATSSTNLFIIHPKYVFIHSKYFIIHSKYFIVHPKYFIIHPVKSSESTENLIQARWVVPKKKKRYYLGISMTTQIRLSLVLYAFTFQGGISGEKITLYFAIFEIHSSLIKADLPRTPECLVSICRLYNKRVEGDIDMQQLTGITRLSILIIFLFVIFLLFFLLLFVLLFS